MFETEALMKSLMSLKLREKSLIVFTQLCSGLTLKNWTRLKMVASKIHLSVAKRAKTKIYFFAGGHLTDF